MCSVLTENFSLFRTHDARGKLFLYKLSHCPGYEARHSRITVSAIAGVILIGTQLRARVQSLL